ncbi:MAG TPA: deoxyribodipyrimidine photolyase, partial [Microscillaceae bacterium]|nr:deoxyribodipyrimidine photolyase [Microscillaceae bacterium]
DLRLHDNAGLYHALRSGKPVLPIFIFDRDILDKLTDKDDKRVDFIHQTLTSIHQELQTLGSSLWAIHHTPLEAFKTLTANFDIEAVYTNHDYEPYALQRDAEVADYLKQHNIAFHTFKDQVILERHEVLSDQGKPYSVFTPYSKKWKKNLTEAHLQSYANADHFGNFLQTTAFSLPTLEAMGFRASGAVFPAKIVREDIIKHYAEKRNLPAVEGTTRLSVHLRFGTVSIRELARTAQKLSEGWLNELIWREFYMSILYHFPHVATGAFKPAYEQITWRNHEEEFQKWCDGTTGYPIVDAGMRELNATGFMHNRVRMIVACFLTKHLLIDWRWGEAYFARKLLDFDLSANNGSWQWASGSGCDAAPYFRVFNPNLQTQKFDKDLKYVRRWVPEFQSFGYPRPIVEHAFARDRALKVYKEGLYG